MGFGLFALIFYLNFEHGLFVYILKQRKKISQILQKLWILKKNLKIYKNKKLSTQFF